MVFLNMNPIDQQKNDFATSKICFAISYLHINIQIVYWLNAIVSIGNE